MAIIVNLDRYRAAKQRVELSQAGLQKLMDDISRTALAEHAWLHTCPMSNSTQYVPNDERCMYCDACQPKGGAA